MSEYYHFCPTPLERGSVILPGNWGRMLKNYTVKNGNLPLLFREQILENVRNTHYSNKVSRLDCCFVLPSIGGAGIYKDITGDRGILYKVRLANEDCSRHEGRWDCVYCVENKPFLEEMQACAHAYWRGEYYGQNRNGGVEILVESPIIIIEQAAEMEPLPIAGQLVPSR